jgi:hypothetical protein
VKRRLRGKQSSPLAVPAQQKQGLDYAAGISELDDGSTAPRAVHVAFPGVVHRIWIRTEDAIAASDCQSDIRKFCLQSWSPQHQILWLCGDDPELLEVAQGLTNCEVRSLLSLPGAHQRSQLLSFNVPVQLIKDAFAFQILHCLGGLIVDLDICWLGRPVPLYEMCCFVPEAMTFSSVHDKLSLSVLAVPQHHALAKQMMDVCWKAVKDYADNITTDPPRTESVALTSTTLTESVGASSELRSAIFPSTVLMPFPPLLQCWPPSASEAPSLDVCANISCTVKVGSKWPMRVQSGAMAWCGTTRQAVDSDAAILNGALEWLDHARPFMRAVLGAGHTDGLLGAACAAIMHSPLLRTLRSYRHPEVIAAVALCHELQCYQTNGAGPCARPCWHLCQLQRWLIARLRTEDQVDAMTGRARALIMKLPGGLFPDVGTESPEVFSDLACEIMQCWTNDERGASFRPAVERLWMYDEERSSRATVAERLTDRNPLCRAQTYV